MKTTKYSDVWRTTFGKPITGQTQAVSDILKALTGHYMYLAS